MKVSLEVRDKQEAAQLRTVWEEPMGRAFINVVGALLPLGDRARTRVLEYVNDALDEDAGRVRIETRGDRHHVEARRRVSADAAADTEAGT